RPPFLARPVIGAAIDHEPIAPIAQLEGEKLCMSAAVETRRRRLAAIEQHERMPRAQALEAAMWRGRGRTPFGIGARQHPVDDRGLALIGAVEERQPAIAVTEKAQHRRAAVDRLLERGRDFGVRDDERGARIDEMAERGELRRRAARDMPAIDEDLGLRLLRQAGQRTREWPVMALRRERRDEAA